MRSENNLKDHTIIPRCCRFHTLLERSTVVVGLAAVVTVVDSGKSNFQINQSRGQNWMKKNLTGQKLSSTSIGGSTLSPLVTVLFPTLVMSVPFSKAYSESPSSIFSIVGGLAGGVSPFTEAAAAVVFI